MPAPRENIWAIHLCASLSCLSAFELFLSFFPASLFLCLTICSWSLNWVLNRSTFCTRRGKFAIFLSLSLWHRYCRSLWYWSVDCSDSFYRRRLVVFNILLLYNLFLCERGTIGWNGLCLLCSIDMKCDDDINTTPFSETTQQQQQQRKTKRKESEGEVLFVFLICFSFFFSNGKQIVLTMNCFLST